MIDFAIIASSKRDMSLNIKKLDKKRIVLNEVK